MSAGPRRYDIDALRVGAFLLLIFFHIGMFYVPNGWHVKSAHILPEIVTPMGLLNPWRLTLLFVISGAATRFMADKFAPRALAAQRSIRLLIPLLFGMLIIVAPQRWAEAVEKKGYIGGFFDFWVDHLIPLDHAFGMLVPAYIHLWFIAYLWVYTMVAIGLWRFLPALDRFAERWLSGVGLFVLPIALFGLYRAYIYPSWRETHLIWWDLYNHAHYFTAFMLGLLLAKQDAAWRFSAKIRLGALLSVIAIGAVALALSGMWEEKPDWRGQLFAFVRAGYVWVMICMLMGYAHHYIRRGSPLLTTLTQAVFPAYIIHQTTIVLVGHLISPYRLPLAWEVSIILLATVLSCAAVYALARAVPLLRLPLGVQPHFAK